jgi:predicted DNA-binding transcriptional regulator AlpA
MEAPTIESLSSGAHAGLKAVTVERFCLDHSISRAMFYKLQKHGQAPRTMRVGSKQYISEEAAADWRRAMEAATASPQAA